MNVNDRTINSLHPPSTSVPFVSSCTSPYDDDRDDAEQERHSFQNFLAVARSICSGVSDADLQDIAQESWISYSRKSKKENLNNPKAYIAQIVRNKFRDHLRKEKRRSSVPAISLSLFTGGPDRELAASAGEGLINPAKELDDQLEKMDFLNTLAVTLPKVAPRQRRAVICMLLDKVDDPLSLKQLLNSHHVDTSEMCWPSDKAEMRLLKASIPAARRTLANLMQIDLYQYKERKPAPHPPTIVCHTIQGDTTSIEAI